MAARLPIALVALALLIAASIEATGAQSPQGICGRTAAVQTAILALHNGHNNTSLACGAMDTAKLNGLGGTLNLENKGINALKAGDFDDLSKLKVLNLNRNNLTTLPKDIFDDLGALTHLFLRNNKLNLSALSSDVFSNLSNLGDLNLGDNVDTGFTNLPTGIFSGLDKLAFLYLDKNRLSGLQGPLPSNLFQLELQFNELTSLPSNLFDGLSNLGRLYLDENRLTSLHPNVFQGLTALQDLWISSNSLTSLPAGLFSGLTKLKLIYAHDNDYGYVPASIIAGLGGLDSFRLGRASPGNVSATTLPNNEIRISWAAPATEFYDRPDRGRLPVTGYAIQASTDGGLNWADVDEDTGDPVYSDATEYTYAPASSGGHLFRVAAYHETWWFDAENPWERRPGPWSAQVHAVAQQERENRQVEEPVEIVFRSDVLRLDTPPEGDTTIVTPFFSINPEYLGGTVAAPDGDWPAALDEAVEQRVLDNIWGVYTVGAVEPIDRYESRFRACDGQPCFRDAEGVDHFVTGPLYTIDLWVIYYMAERGWNSVRLARAPFDPPLTVCLPRVQTDRFAAWDKKQMRWRLLEAIESEDSSLTCAYTPILDAFIAVKD